MTWEVRLEAPDGTVTTLQADDIVKESPKVRHEQLAVSEWSARVPHRVGLEEFRHAAGTVSYQGEVVMRGPVTAVESTDGSGETTVRGKDFVDELRRSRGDRANGLVYPVTDQQAWKAIEDLYAKQFFDPYVTTVVEPTAEPVDSQKSIQSADTTSEFENAWNPDDTIPFKARNDALELVQTGFFQEAETASGGNGTVSDGEYSAGEGELVQDTTGDLRYSIDLDYTIPAEHVGFAVRSDTLDGSHPPYDILVNGETVDSVPPDSFSSGLDWKHTALSGIQSDLPPGKYTAQLDATGVGAGDMEVDCLFVYDARYSYSFDNSVDGDGYLSGPELYPDMAELQAEEASANWNITRAYVTITADDLSGGQRLQVQLTDTFRPTDGSEDNTEAITVDNQGASSTAQSRVRLARYGSRSTASPTSGFNGQRVTSYDLSVDTNDIAIIEDETYKGSVFDVWQALHQDGNMTAVAEATDSSRELLSLEPGDRTRGQDWTVLDHTRAYETDRYGNRIQGVGGTRDDGTRVRVTVTDDGEVSRVGEVVEAEPIIRTGVVDENVLRSAARNKLAAVADQDRLAGDLTVVPTHAAPGVAYTVGPFDDSAVALLSMSIRGDRATLRFRAVDRLASAIADTTQPARTTT
jgi:hypothetical protein